MIDRTNPDQPLDRSDNDATDESVLHALRKCLLVVEYQLDVHREEVHDEGESCEFCNEPFALLCWMLRDRIAFFESCLLHSPIVRDAIPLVPTQTSRN